MLKEPKLLLPLLRPHHHSSEPRTPAALPNSGCHTHGPSGLASRSPRGCLQKYSPPPTHLFHRVGCGRLQPRRQTCHSLVGHELGSNLVLGYAKKIEHGNRYAACYCPMERNNYFSQMVWPPSPHEITIWVKPYKAILAVGFPLHKRYPYIFYRFSYLYVRYIWWQLVGFKLVHPMTKPSKVLSLNHPRFCPPSRTESHSNKTPRNRQRSDPRFTDPEQTWVSNSSITTIGSLVVSKQRFFGQNQVIITTTRSLRAPIKNLVIGVWGWWLIGNCKNWYCSSAILAYICQVREILHYISIPMLLAKWFMMLLYVFD